MNGHSERNWLRSCPRNIAPRTITNADRRGHGACVGAERQAVATVRRSGSCLGQFYCNPLRPFSIDDSDPNVREFSFKL